MYQPRVPRSHPAPSQSRSPTPSASGRVHRHPSQTTPSATPTATARTRISSATVPPGGRRTKSPRRRLSATVAWTSAPGRNVPSGVATMSPSPRADTPTNTMRPPSAPAGNRSCSTSTAEKRGKAPAGSAEAHEHAPVGVEGDLAVAEPESRPPRRGVRDPEPLRGEARANGGERQARVDLAAELDDLGHAPEDPVRVRRRVHEAGGGGRRPERVEAAEDPRRSRHLRQGAPRGGAPQADRAKPARTVDGPVEREGVAHHEGPAPDRRRERRVPDRERGRLAGAARPRRRRRRPNRAPRRGCPDRSPPPRGCEPGRGAPPRGRGATASARPRPGSARRP